MNEKCTGCTVGAAAYPQGTQPGGPSQLIENVHSTRRGGACPRPRGTILVSGSFRRIREETIFFLFACPKRKNQRETTLGRGRLRFLPLPRPTLIETPKRGAPLLDHPRALRIRPGGSVFFRFPRRSACLPLRGRCRAATVGAFPPDGDKPRPYMGTEGFRPCALPVQEIFKKSKKALAIPAKLC